MKNRKRPCSFAVLKLLPEDQRESECDPGTIWVEGEGLFHRWATQPDINENKDGFFCCPITVGIVEDESGQCHSVAIDHIKFTDR